jgi:hypothetical protein
MMMLLKTRFSAVAFVTLPLLLCGCAQPLKVSPQSVARGREQLYKFENKEVTLVGRVIADGKQNALELDDGTRVNVSELQPWEKKMAGNKVTVRGVLRRGVPAKNRAAGTDEWFELRAVRWVPGDLGPKKRDEKLKDADQK